MAVNANLSSKGGTTTFARLINTNKIYHSEWKGAVLTVPDVYEKASSRDSYSVMVKTALQMIWINGTEWRHWHLNVVPWSLVF